MTPWKLIDYGQRHKPTPLAKMTPVYDSNKLVQMLLMKSRRRHQEMKKKIHESALDSESGHKVVSSEPWTTTVPAAALHTEWTSDPHGR
jgi:hypothetical protein